MSTKSYLKVVCDAYRDAAKTPLLVSARVDASSNTSSMIPITTRWSQSNLSTNQKVTFNKQVMVNASKLSVEYESVGVAETGREMSTVGGEGEEEVVAIVRKADKDDCQNIELWTRVKGMLATFNMKEVDVHGKIYTDGEFGALELSADRKSLLYIAEKKKEKNVAFLYQGEVGETAKVGGMMVMMIGIVLLDMSCRLDMSQSIRRTGESRWWARLTQSLSCWTWSQSSQ